LTASVAGAEYSLPALEFGLASRIADYVASAAGARRPRREVLKGLLSINDLSLAAASAHLHLAQSSDDPAIRSKDWPITTRSLVREQPTTLRWRQIDSPTDARQASR
jgi:hypothetical protein